VYLGQATAPLNASADGTLSATGAGDRLGSATMWARDVNGDGYGDVVSGAYNSSTPASMAGRAFVYFGASGTTFETTADGTLNGAAASDNFGTSVD
jgi:hypothetical protein